MSDWEQYNIVDGCLEDKVSYLGEAYHSSVEVVGVSFIYAC